MASGIGKDGVNRCFPYFQELKKCAVLSDNAPRDCLFQYEDYMECLHERKAMARAAVVAYHAAKNVADKETQVSRVANVTRVDLISEQLRTMDATQQSKVLQELASKSKSSSASAAAH